MGAVEDKEHEGGAAGRKLTGTMHYVVAQPLAGKGCMGRLPAFGANCDHT